MPFYSGCADFVATNLPDLAPFVAMCQAREGAITAPPPPPAGYTCYLRGGVNLGMCEAQQPGYRFDTWTMGDGSKRDGPWAPHLGVNCYPGRGAAWGIGPIGRSGLPAGQNFTAGSCKAECEANTRCTAITLGAGVPSLPPPASQDNSTVNLMTDGMLGEFEDDDWTGYACSFADWATVSDLANTHELPSNTTALITSDCAQVRELHGLLYGFKLLLWEMHREAQRQAQANHLRPVRRPDAVQVCVANLSTLQSTVDNRPCCTADRGGGKCQGCGLGGCH